MIHDLFYFLLGLAVLHVDIQLIVGQNTKNLERPTIVPSKLGKIFVKKGNDATGICFDAVTGMQQQQQYRQLRVRRGPDYRKVRVTEFKFDGRCLHIFAQYVRNTQYEISVSNRYGRATATFSLIYCEVPGIRLTYLGRVLLNNQYVLLPPESASVAVECEISCDSVPALGWYHNGRAIDVTETGQGCLMITNASASNGGRYTVAARNVKGIAPASFVLHLPGLPQIYSFCTSLIDTVSCNSKYLELRCSASNLPSPVVTINVTGETSSSSNRFSVPYREIIRNTSKRNFTCSASNYYGTVTETCMIHVKIGRPPVLAIGNYDTIVKVIENKTHVFNCSLASEPFPLAAVTWFQGHVEKTEWRNFSIVEVKSSANIHMVPFTCRVSNDCGHDARTFILDVGVSPQIDRFCMPLDETLFCNVKNLKLRCAASGFPIPVVTISVNGKANSSSNLHSVTHREIVRNTSDRNFICSASNFYGTVTKTCSIRFKIGRTPKLAIEDHKQTANVQKNIKHYLNCSLAFDPLIPTTITWFQGRLEKTEWHNFSIVEVTTSEDMHMVPFKCTVINDCGHEARTFILNVEDPPQIEQFCNNMEHSVYCRTHRLKLPCSATGNPSPIVTVTRKLGNSGTARARSSIMYRETLTDTTEEYYTCSASNYLGHVTADCFVRITIDKPLNLAGGVKYVTVKLKEGQKHRFNCSVSANTLQAASTHWFVNNTENMDWRNFSTVDLRARINMHMVPFTCRVSNYCGHEKRHFRVFIEAKCRIFIDANQPFFTSSLCTSEACLRLAYNQTVSLTALVRCFPYSPDTRIRHFHFNQRRFTNINFFPHYYTDRDGAKAVKIDLTVRKTGTYEFRVRNTKTIISVIAQPSLINDNTDQVLLTASHPVRKLACTIRLSPSDPRIKVIWAGTKSISTAIVSKNLGVDGAVYITSTLLVTRPGQYSCLLEATGESRNFTVKTVFVDARLIPNRAILVGESFSLQCVLSIRTTIVWLYNGKVIRKIKDSNYNTLFIHQAQQHHEGIYSCSLQGLVQQNIVVAVEAPPLITNFCSNYGRPAMLCNSKHLVLSCSGSGDPIPSVTITGMGTVEFRSIGVRFVAVYREAMQHTGYSNHACLATNIHGTVNSGCYITIGKSPHFLNTISGVKVQVQVEEHQTMSLPCDVSDETFPPPKRQWYYYHNEMKHWKNYSAIKMAATLSDDGATIRCVVTNECGSTRRNFFPKVTAPCRMSVATNGNMYGKPRSNTLPLTSSQCNSNICVNLPYQETITINGAARCYPKRPTLILMDPKGHKVIAVNVRNFQDAEKAYITNTSGIVNQVGKYTFQVQDDSAVATINVIALPTFVSPSVANAAHFVILTDDHRSQTLVCNARSYPRHPHIEWSSNVRVTVPSRTTYAGDDGAIYLNSKLVVDVVGTYTCLLKLSSDQETFIVNAAPMFETMRNESALTISASVGSRVQLDCKLLNSLESRIEWFDDHREVFRWRDQSQPYLSIRLGDCGEMTFSCRAKNPYGIARRTFIINVRDVNITAITVPASTVAAGAKISLRCIVERNGYSMRWERDQSVIGQSTTGNRNLTLIISNVTPSNEGKYECIAWRNDCTVKSSVFLNVEVPPRIEDYCPSETVHCRKNSLELTCKASGDPPPQVMIKRKGFLSSVTGIHPGLAVYRGNVTQIGNNVFVCNAKNRQGEATKACHITTFSAPRFVNNFLARFVKQGRQVHLWCHLVGKWLLPITNVIWYEGSIEKKEWNNKQTVSWIATLADHLKEYRCKVTNLCGSSIRQFSLYVT